MASLVPALRLSAYDGWQIVHPTTDPANAVIEFLKNVAEYIDNVSYSDAEEGTELTRHFNALSCGWLSSLLTWTSLNVPIGRYILPFLGSSGDSICVSLVEDDKDLFIAMAKKIFDELAIKKKNSHNVGNMCRNVTLRINEDQLNSIIKKTQRNEYVYVEKGTLLKTPRSVDAFLDLVITMCEAMPDTKLKNDPTVLYGWRTMSEIRE